MVYTTALGRQRLISEAYGGRDRLCPMKGKRLPELVAGELEDLLLRLGKWGQERLMAKVKVYVTLAE